MGMREVNGDICIDYPFVLSKKQAENLQALCNAFYYGDGKLWSLCNDIFRKAVSEYIEKNKSEISDAVDYIRKQRKIIREREQMTPEEIEAEAQAEREFTKDFREAAEEFAKEVEFPVKFISGDPNAK